MCVCLCGPTRQRLFWPVAPGQRLSRHRHDGPIWHRQRQSACLREPSLSPAMVPPAGQRKKPAQPSTNTHRHTDTHRNTDEQSHRAHRCLSASPTPRRNQPVTVYSIAVRVPVVQPPPASDPSTAAACRGVCRRPTRTVRTYNTSSSSLQQQL